MFVFFFNDTATTEIYTLSLHDALPISPIPRICRIVSGRYVRGSANARSMSRMKNPRCPMARKTLTHSRVLPRKKRMPRSEEHTSELQSRQYLVCRLLLEKKKKLNTQ